MLPHFWVPGSNFQTDGTMKLNLKECSLKDSKFHFGICSNFLFENQKNEKVSAERFICALINWLVLLLGAQQTSEVHINNVCSTGYHWLCFTNVVLWKKTCSTVCDRPWAWGYCVEAGILLSLASMLQPKQNICCVQSSMSGLLDTGILLSLATMLQPKQNICCVQSSVSGLLDTGILLSLASMLQPKQNIYCVEFYAMSGLLDTGTLLSLASIL